MSDEAPDAATDEAHDERTDTVDDRALEDWIGHQRWYTAKGTRPRLQTLATPDGTRLVLDDALTGPVLYQAPVVHRDGAVTDATTDLDWVRSLAARIDADPDSLRPIGTVTAARVLSGEYHLSGRRYVRHN